ncbi:MAG: hypothetical protein ACI9FN_003740, partial [Saprospiraceae bacterium]
GIFQQLKRAHQFQDLNCNIALQSNQSSII